MEFIEVIKAICMALVCWKGGTITLNGATIYGEGKSQNAPGKQEEGMEKLTGGGIVIIVGVVVVPKLFDWLVGMI